jgi:hypothetical protein
MNTLFTLKISGLWDSILKTGLISGILSVLFLSCSGQQAGEQNLRKICRLPAELRESSGLVCTRPNLFWSHNDANNPAILYSFDTLGTIRRTLTIAGFPNTDWEDLATDDDGNIYIADLGNNSNSRTDLCILRIPDPDNIPGDEVIPEVIRVAYADQSSFPPSPAEKNFDVEALIWREGFLYLFTKDRSSPFTGICKMYKVPAIPGSYQPMPQDEIFLGSDSEKARVTAAAYNRHNGMLCLLTHDRILCFTDYPSDHFFDGQLTTYFLDPLPGQNEAIDFFSSGKLYMTEEGSGGAAGFLYEFKFPHSTGMALSTKLNNKLTAWVLQGSRQLLLKALPNHVFRYEIHSLDGRLWKTEQGLKGSIDISGLPNGIYFIRLLDARGKILGTARFQVL